VAVDSLGPADKDNRDVVRTRNVCNTAVLTQPLRCSMFSALGISFVNNLQSDDRTRSQNSAAEYYIVIQ